MAQPLGWAFSRLWEKTIRTEFELLSMIFIYG